MHLTNFRKLTHTAELPLHIVQDIPAEIEAFSKQRFRRFFFCLVQIWNVFVLP